MEEQKTFIVVGIPHAGSQIPLECQESFLTLDKSILLQDPDLYVDEIYAPALKEFQLPHVLTSVNRYVIDCNRNADDIDDSFCEGAPHNPLAKNLGLIAHKTVSGTPLLKRKLTLVEVEHRIKNYHQPYHQKLTTFLEEARNREGLWFSYEAHSMPSQGKSGHDDNGKPRPDICLGDRDGKSCHPLLVETIRQTFEAQGLQVKMNFPYKGAQSYVTQHYGHPDQGKHSLLVEINRALYMDETTFEKTQNFSALQNIVTQILKNVLSIPKNLLK